MTAQWILTAVVIVLIGIYFFKRYFGREGYTNRVHYQLKKAIMENMEENRRRLFPFNTGFTGRTGKFDGFEGSGPFSRKEGFGGINADHVYGWVHNRSEKEAFTAMKEGYRNVSDKAAEQMLTRIDNSITRLRKHLERKYPNDPRVKRFKERYRGDDIKEIDPHNWNGDTSYVLGKGREIGFCVRQKTANKELVDMDAMMYVAIHEMAHLVSKGIGHGNEFKENQKWLLREARESGVYDYSTDFSKKPIVYCGMVINDPKLV